jgi:predicted amidophosphoribosyltransferase
VNALTIAEFADYTPGDLCRDCGTLIDLGQTYCPSCSRKRVWARRKVRRVIELARHRRAVFAWYEMGAIVGRALRRVRYVG